MPLITLFSAPKPFTNPHIAMIQRNAIKSWTLLPDVEVILLGEEEGLAEAAQRTWREAHSACGMQYEWHTADFVHVSTGTRKQQQRPALHHQRGHDSHA